MIDSKDLARRAWAALCTERIDDGPHALVDWGTVTQWDRELLQGMAGHISKAVVEQCIEAIATTQAVPDSSSACEESLRGSGSYKEVEAVRPDALQVLRAMVEPAEEQAFFYTWEHWRAEVDRRTEVHKRAMELYGEWLKDNGAWREPEEG